MQRGYTELKTYRYERKFVAMHSSRLAVESVVRQNNAFFIPAYQPRKINNVYFDTPGLDCYFDNLFGNGHRWKARIRWYNETFCEARNPILEFKIKKGLVGTKQSFPLPSFEITRNGFNAKSFELIFEKANLPEVVRAKLNGLQPVLLNSYNRSYFKTLNKKFRVTVDDNLGYYDMRSTWNFFPKVYKEEFKTVVELKYDEEWNDEASQITNQFPFRLDKNSKFVAGMNHFKNEIAE